MIMARRCWSILLASRRGVPYAASPTSAWTSTNTGREPTIDATTHDPGASLRRERKNRADGLAISSSPVERIAKTQISSIDPKRFLYARKMRTSPLASPSKYNTVSTRCSTMRGPAIEPSFVTWPTMNVALCRPRTFGKLDQRLRAIANLAEAAGVRLRRGQPRRLDRIDDEYLGRTRFEPVEYRAKIGLREQRDRSVDLQTARSQLDLRGRLFAANVRDRAVLAQPCGELQQQRGFSGSRRPADQRDARRYDSAAQGCIELGQAGAHPLDVRFVDVSEHYGFAVGDCPGRCSSRGGNQEGALVERVPGVAGRASPQPARRFESARGTRVHRSGLGHRPDVLQRTRNNRPVPGLHPLQIAIDGPAASGKTTVGRLLAQRLGVPYLDTGAMYRALAYLAVRTRTDADNAAALVRLAAAHPLDVVVSEDASAFVIRAGDETLDDAVLQSNEVTAVVSTVAAHAAVR